MDRKEEMKQAIINFLSSRFNLTIFQCLLYFVIGWVMGEYLTWPKLGLMFVVMFGIQFITRTKAVADGMVFREMMINNQVDANEIVKRMKEEADRMNKEDLNQEKKRLDSHGIIVVYYICKLEKHKNNKWRIEQ